MRVSTKVEYGIVALADIAMNSGDGTVVTASDIARRQDIPRKYLEQILLRLKQTGSLRAHKGSGGGYTLARSTDSIKLSQIIDALDDTLLADNEPDIRTSRLRRSVSECFWSRLTDLMKGYADSITLSELISECALSSDKDSDMYVI
ncbi:MAG: Rrf2 family transcriptional regulator [Oscillospiraceae bacterium]|nr:Rrf2 family transcriptional regulator [Oscillospiraceae bacterium]